MNADPKAAARAIDALRRGWPIAIAGQPLLAVETADPLRLAAFDPEARAPVLISAGRAATLKLTNQVEAADPDAAVLVERAPRIDGMLPAFFLGGTGVEAAISLADIAAHENAEALAIATRARLPVAGAEDAEIVAFRSPHAAGEHVALLIGQPNGQPPLVRLHSECLTGDVLGSLKCDCGPQLHAAIHAIAEAGWGILLYLRQEGRGIGLVNKLRAYQLQDQGFDTVDANTRLGFAIDARDFGVAARMLTLMKQDKVRLLTNNPAKVAGLNAAGVKVVERVAHSLPPNPHNERYLATKRDRTGHQL